jgi:hypothetical protein
MPPFVTLASAGSQTLHRVKALSRVAEMSVMQRIARHCDKTRSAPILGNSRTISATSSIDSN